MTYIVNCFTMFYHCYMYKVALIPGNTCLAQNHEMEFLAI